MHAQACLIKHVAGLKGFCDDAVPQEAAQPIRKGGVGGSAGQQVVRAASKKDARVMLEGHQTGKQRFCQRQEVSVG